MHHACKRSTQPSGRDPSSDRYDSVSDLYGHICPEKQTGRRKWQGVVPAKKVFCISPGGLIAVIAGGNLVVDNACIIAESFGVSQNFIGLTIIAVGTSLPELVTSIVATRKGDSGLALGNAIGSNIFNILFILGISAAITPLAVLSESVIDCILLLLSAILLYIFAAAKSPCADGKARYVSFYISLIRDICLCDNTKTNIGVKIPEDC